MFKGPLFCDIYGNLCFENMMDNATIEEYCHCPMECNSISYSFSLVSIPFAPEAACPPQKDGHNLNDDGLFEAITTQDFLMKPFYQSKSPPQFVRKLFNLKNNVSYDDMDYCKNHLNKRAEVIFKMATDSMSVTVMSRRLSFFDKMSAFGEKKSEFATHCCNSTTYLLFYSRWNFRTVYWNQYTQYDGGSFLDPKIFHDNCQQEKSQKVIKIS